MLKNHFIKNNLIQFFIHSLLVGIFYIIIMSFFRVGFFFYFKGNLDTVSYVSDIFQSFFLGLRLDLTVVGYIYALAFILAIVLYLIKISNFKFFKYYYSISFITILILTGSDFGFYSYFKEHINILFFGLFDDDTSALIVTFWDNYNVVAILTVFFSIILLGYFIINKIFSLNIQIKESILTKNITLLFLALLIFIFLIIRGTFGMYPLGKMLPNVSSNPFINQVTQNPVRSFIRAYKTRKRFQNNSYNLIHETGYKGKIEEAFKIHSQKEKFDKKNLLNNITYKTDINIEDDLNVVVIMVESFGMPILKHNSQKFDLLGEMKQHFKEDLLFKNCLSTADGTVASLESLILNISFRPKSFPFAQSPLKQTSFTYTPAFLYNAKGYESTFIYGGDLTWRDIGSFIKHQGYKTEGKIDIYNSITKKENFDYYHAWGIYDEFLFEHIEKKLINSKKPQFIVALSTNNHPPYTIPKQYKSKKLHMSEELKKYLTGDLDLAQKRFYSFQYAVDQAGKFLTRIKNSKLKENTIVVITADNNTVDGIMRYKDNTLFNSKNIPLLFYIPKKLKKQLGDIDTSAYASHKDIFPTLYNMTLNDISYKAIGTNILDSSKKHIAMNGSMIVSSKEKTVKLNSLSEKSNDEFKEYYKATLAVEEFLIRSYRPLN